jgi:two-component system chemotaxis response regulator CheY
MFAPDTNILVVDDMMTMRKIIKKTLTDLGFSKFTEAENGVKGWEKVQLTSPPFGLIICDWNMPEMNGLELLKKVRAHPPTARTPFMLLTAESEKSQVIDAVKARVNGYCVKPFTSEDLSAKLKAVYETTQKKAA